MKIVMAKTAIELLNNAAALEAYRLSTSEKETAGNRRSSNTNAQAAADIAIQSLANLTGSSGGLILLDCEGSPSVAFNTQAMSYGYVQPGGAFRIFP